MFKFFKDKGKQSAFKHISLVSTAEEMKDFSLSFKRDGLKRLSKELEFQAISYFGNEAFFSNELIDFYNENFRLTRQDILDVLSSYGYDVVECKNGITASWNDVKGKS